VRRFTGGKRFPTDERDDGSPLVSYKETEDGRKVVEPRRTVAEFLLLDVERSELRRTAPLSLSLSLSLARARARVAARKTEEREKEERCCIRAEPATGNSDGHEQQRERLGGPSHLIGRLATGSSRSLSLARGVIAVGIDRRRSLRLGPSSSRARFSVRRTRHPTSASASSVRSRDTKGSDWNRRILKERDSVGKETSLD